MRKVQRVLVRASSRWARKQLIETYSSHSRVGEGQTMSDIAHTTLSLSRSQASRVFRGSLWFACNRVPTADFVASCRYILNLPQLQRPGFQKGADVGEEGEAASFCVCSKHAPATMGPREGTRRHARRHSRPDTTSTPRSTELWGDSPKKPGACSPMNPKHRSSCSTG